MKTIITGVIATILLIILSVSCAVNQNKAQQKQEEERSREELLQEINTLNSQLRTAENKPAEIDKKLQEENESLKQQIAELEQKNKDIQNNESNKFEKILFWTDGKKYNSEVTWYKDCYCSSEITEATILISPKTYEVELKNGLTVYCAISQTGIVWATRNPDLKEVQE